MSRSHNRWSHTMTLPSGRVLKHVPNPGPMRDRARQLKARCDQYLPPWSLDHGWVAGRGAPMVLAKLMAVDKRLWLYIDIVRCFDSIPQDRLFHILRRLDRRLARDLDAFFAKVGCESGVPEGCSFSPALVNIYLGNLDRRWQGRMLRYADNLACANAGRVASELRDIGLQVRHQERFIRSTVAVTRPEDEGWLEPRSMTSTGPE